MLIIIGSILFITYSSTFSADVGRRKFEAELEEQKSKVLEHHRLQTVQVSISFYDVS